MENENIIIPSEYADICPIQDKDFHNEMSILVNEPMFKQIAQIVMPQYNYTQFKILLLSLNSKYDLQTKVMKPFIDGLLAKTSKGLTASGLENLVKDVPNTFITNHRDIVLDSALLSYLMLENDMDTCEIAIGNNLLIYNWITKLVRLNKCFIVKRNLGRLQTMAAALQLSAYMHFVLKEKKGSIWIAQREGRCKDSNDRTQESLIKMLTYGNREVPFIESLKEMLNHGQHDNLSFFAFTFIVLLWRRASMGMTLAALRAGTRVEIKIVTAAQMTIARITHAVQTIGMLPRIPSDPARISASRTFLPRNVRVTFVPIYPMRSPRGMPAAPRRTPSKKTEKRF